MVLKYRVYFVKTDLISCTNFIYSTLFATLNGNILIFLILEILKAKRLRSALLFLFQKYEEIL